MTIGPITATNMKIATMMLPAVTLRLIVTTLQKRRSIERTPANNFVDAPDGRGGMADSPPALSAAVLDTGGSGVCFMLMRSSPGARAGRVRNRARQPPDSSLRLPQ